MTRPRDGGSELTLVLGGARSGKSRYAESLIEGEPPPWIYVATGEGRAAERAGRAPANHDGAVVLVSNEVGSGIVPDNALARRFQDLQGALNQRIAAKASRVVLLVAGLPLVVKGTP